MGKIKKLYGKAIQSVIDWAMGTGLMQEELTAEGNGSVTKEISAAARKTAAEGIVLLKNDGTHPLDKDKSAAFFERCQQDWFYVGYGSGGDVHPPYKVNLMEGIKNIGAKYDTDLAEKYEHWCKEEKNVPDHGWWGHWPFSYPEMPIEEKTVLEAAEKSDTAIVVIGRAAGEERENILKEGSYYLTKEERELLDAVTAKFEHVVVLMNAGNIIDMAWTEEYGDKISAILYVWLGGMESGNAAADVLYGRVNPCGRLADTIARHYEDYPSSKNFGGKEYNCYEEDVFAGYRWFESFGKEKVLWPFGFGLSYTEFEHEVTGFFESEGKYKTVLSIKNTGKLLGKDVAMLFCEAPEGKLGKPKRVLTAFGKTKELLPGEKQELVLEFDEKCFASFDDDGRTGFLDSFVLEAGEYRFFIEEKETAKLEIPETRCVEKCESACFVKESFERTTGFGKNERVEHGNADLKKRILERLPEEIKYTGDKGIKLADVANKKASLDAFVAQLSDEELEMLSHGEGGMGSTLGVPGNAGAFGGISPVLREKGILPMITADGPAGLRLKRHCALLPCGTAIACTWNTELIEELFANVGDELIKHGVDIILSPGMNIHRNPLCGRNFEYFSEDPLLCGKTAAAAVRGIQSRGVFCCPKHFAANNQEKKRNTNDSRVSERALREIYLRGFEICVKEGKPNAIMTSYNKINGVWAHYNYDLVTTILRGEWGYNGMVMTDWWMQRSKSPEFPDIADNAYRIRAQVDVLMPGNMNHANKKLYVDKSVIKSLEKEGGLTRGELQRNAKNVLRLIIKAKYK